MRDKIENRAPTSIREMLIELLFNRYINMLFRSTMGPIITHSEMKSLGIPVVGKLKFKFGDGKCLYLDSDGNDAIANKIYWCGLNSFEGETTSLFLGLVSKSRVFFDIGANTGIYTMLAAIQNPSTHIFAFEPLPKVFSYLKHNVETNHLKNTRTENYAISNYNGKINLYVPKSRMLPSSASTLKGFKAASYVLEVPAIKLDAYCKKRRLRDVDLIKIDTEATEHLVIEGALETIMENQPIIICEVLKNRTEKFLNGLLDNIDYEYYWISDAGLIKYEEIIGNNKNKNYLFVTEKRKSILIELGYL